MRNLILSLSLAALCLLPTLLRAEAYADAFAMDETSIQADFADLNQLESYVLAQGATVAVAAIPANIIPQNFDAHSGLNSPNFTIDSMDWGSFAWGFCCWPIGFFVVAINSNKSSDEKLSFWIGTGVSVVLSGISTLVRVAASGV